ncbi:MAG TPA: plasmid pRiA4b ORF-3 family protein [Thermoanaerobaculia bacterium]|nr:plasmid pRiA4b ORF-3 family protein [Thermoanaerobaculia bacterium]
MENDTTSGEKVLRLRIELDGVTPPVWREIEVPADYDFWSLHVAIQDAMGWTDTHLHEFVLDPKSGETDSLVIGIPDPRAPDSGPRPGWEYPIGPFLHQGAPPVDYLYDFGDGWRHGVSCVGERSLADPAERRSIPRCLAGARACPLEDCGGPPAYSRLLELANLQPDQVPEPDRDLYEWMPPGFDPEEFDPAQVVFSDPQARLAAVLDPDFPDEDDQLVGFTPGRFDQRSLSEALIDETWIETAELGPRHALKTYDEVAKRQPHLLGFLLDETEMLGEEARELGHFIFVAMFRMFWKAGGKKIRKVPRARIDRVQEILERAEEGTLSDPEIALLGLDGELSRQPILNEFLADLISDDSPDAPAEELTAAERDALFERMRVVVEVLDAELRR